MAWKYVLRDPRRMVPPICVFDPCTDSTNISRLQKDEFSILPTLFTLKHKHKINTDLRHKYDIWILCIRIKFGAISIL